MIRRARGVSLEIGSRTAARSLGVASVGPGKRIPARGKGLVNTTQEMMRVWEEMAPNVTKTFGDGRARGAPNVRRWVAESSPRHPKGLFAELVRQELKPKANGQRCRNRAGWFQEGNLVDEADEKGETQWVDTFAF